MELQVMILDDDEIRKLAGEWVEKWLEVRKKGEW